MKRFNQIESLELRQCQPLSWIWRNNRVICFHWNESSPVRANAVFSGGWLAAPQTDQASSQGSSPDFVDTSWFASYRLECDWGMVCEPGVAAAVVVVVDVVADHAPQLRVAGHMQLAM